MRLLGASVAVVTTDRNGEPLGLTATSVCSVSADPPHLLVCVNRDAEAHDTIAASGRFAINLLGAQHRALAERFAGRTGIDGPQRFVDGGWRRGADGCPLLADAPASFECRVARAVGVATHTVFIGEVVAIDARPPAEVLAYRDGRFGAFVAQASRPEPAGNSAGLVDDPAA